VRGAGAHEQRDVLLVLVVGAVDQRAQRNPECEADRDGRGEVGRHDLQ